MALFSQSFRHVESVPRELQTSWLSVYKVLSRFSLIFNFQIMMSLVKGFVGLGFTWILKSIHLCSLPYLGGFQILFLQIILQPSLSSRGENVDDSSFFASPRDLRLCSVFLPLFFSVLRRNESYTPLLMSTDSVFYYQAHPLRLLFYCIFQFCNFPEKNAKRLSELPW